ncbi:cell division protein FtsA C-terminal domain-containing protein [Streptococcus pyogenes]|uniref:cell division protein FtsA C-terminal domain-containing protein n=1 Tax=Streptococcus pyogenes TaxID=1314 RepID=UPI0038FC59B1
MDFSGQESYLPDYDDSRRSESTIGYEQQASQTAYDSQVPSDPKQKISERVRGIFGSMFD